MAQLARVVIPGVPHYVTLRGNRRQTTFFGDDDHAAYLDLLGHWSGQCGLEVWELPNKYRVPGIDASLL